MSYQPRVNARMGDMDRAGISGGGYSCGVRVAGADEKLQGRRLMFRQIKLFLDMRRRVKLVEAVAREYERLQGSSDMAFGAFTAALICAMSRESLDKTFAVINKLSEENYAGRDKIN